MLVLFQYKVPNVYWLC